ncbi:MAG: hypothetical protein KA902_04710 [Arenimonas sp.]|nr:hypothetical protein [Arenimonas sp.]
MEIEIPEQLRAKLGAEMKMDFHWIDVKLNDGRVYRGMEVRGGRYITGFKDNPYGRCDAPFSSADIKDISRETSILYFLAKVFELFRIGLFGRTK